MSQQVAGEPARSCLKFRDASTDKLYFVYVTRHGEAGEEASADLAVTDGAAAWTAEGAGGRVSGCPYRSAVPEAAGCASF